MNVKISLTELEEGKTYTIEQYKHWFPKGKFDKRFPQEFIKKWLRRNAIYLEFLGISYRFDENNNFILTPSNKVGLAPLKNPYGGQIYGSIVVKPRLKWEEIYKILNVIEWKYQPDFIKDEEPILSDGVLPRWFKAIETLNAISAAINLFMKGVDRKHIMSKVPIGSVNWNEYARKSLPYCKYDSFHTTISEYSYDLEVHRQFKGIVKIITEDISNSKVPIKIKNKAKTLLARIDKKLEMVSYDEPNVYKLKKARIPYFYKIYYEKAIQKCIEYIEESKFSLKTDNYYGLPWRIEMDRLFEHWVEYWAYKFSKMIGANYFSDIKRNSRIRFHNLGNWKSMAQLRPDIIIEKDSKTLILEVKYKKHLFYLQYGKSTQEVLEEHRHDLHQLLAYMSTSQSNKRIGCLMYPAVGENTYNQFATLINYTNIRANVDIVLCGVSFNEEDQLKLLEYIWNEKYMPFV